MARYHPDEHAREHLRNALCLVRLALETAEVRMDAEGARVFVPVETLNAIQGRLEAALARLEPPPTVLPFPQPED